MGVSCGWLSELIRTQGLHPVPGGLGPGQVLELILGAHWYVVGMDVVEVNPRLDGNDQTAILAARLLHEGMGYVAKQR